MRASRGALVVAAVGVALACGPIQPAAGPDAPMNSCPDHPCAAYAQSGAAPVCNGGQCLVATEFSNLVLVASLPQDSPFAPDRTFVSSFDASFFDAPPPPSAGATACPPDRRCVWLQGIADITGSFTAQPQDAQHAGWNLGNQGNTWLPAQAIYRRVWTPPSGGPPVDATSLGLPVDAIPSDVVAATAPPGSTLPPGPNGGPSLVFEEANLPPGTYELTLMPLPPLDRAFPPDVEVLDVTSGRQTTSIGLILDKTRDTDPSGNLTYPTFDITRDAGLDGWTAYLRDATTLRRISNVASLGGVTTTGVQLMTDHHQSDALTNAQLVVQPPVAQHVPTYIASLQGGQLPRSESYPTLPAPIAVSGSVTAADGSPLQAQLLFDAISGNIDSIGPKGDVEDYPNLEFSARTSARIGGRGASSYAITLPQGQYRLTIRPLDTTAAITIVQPFVVAPPNPLPGQAAASNPNVAAKTPQLVQGAASVADGRPLAGATIDAVPLQCFDSTASPSCMPRAAQTTTASDGSYAFGSGGGAPGLDPGSYVLRVRPADGTHFPWVWQSIVVGPTPVNAPTLVVPAPAYAGLRLFDAASNPVINAVVRMFALQPKGPAVEVARAITDTNGDYDMYLAPAAPASK